ncbi:MAG TPA: SDR family NAD(P)-dependent oxidoreductase [Acidimicrobiales bacterium]|jgi:NAD(P)-dependent dehydrogenase (short-subunit alcohol dehydrogenase family)|nr:SDR family NAD(P)-dependent oxidoreductase [Acidimicrobiales bacterium]
MPDLAEPGQAPGKVALVTGGASGIGLAATRRFARDGIAVAVGDVNDQALESVRGELGDAIRTLRCDVSQESDVEALASLAMNEFGRLDIAFANAGIGSSSAIVDIDIADWTRVLEVNLVGSVLTIKHAARRMRPGGSIVVTASLNAVQPGLGMSAYCASKAGIKMLVEVAALELGGAGIRVNAIGPGLVRTGLTEGVWLVPSIVDEFRENTPLDRYSTPEEIANLVVFLSSEEAAFISGSFYLIDGGAHTMRYPDIPARIAEATR